MKKLSRFRQLPSLSRITELTNIINSVNPMEPSLDQVAQFLTPEIITSVLQEHQKNPHLCFRFFIWASKRSHFRTWVSRNFVISTLISNNFNVYWNVIDEVKKLGFRISSEAFSVLIAGYWEMKDCEKALEVFTKMKEFDCVPNLFTYNLVLHILVNKGMILLALGVYNFMLKLNCELNCSTYSILIDGLCKSSKVSDALRLFDEMSSRGIVPSNITYTVVLSGLCQAKRIDDAYRLFDSMKSDGNESKRDVISYNALLNGICKMGRMDEAFVFLKRFKEDGYDLDLNSYSSLIDGLFRVKRFKEAHDMFDKMMTETDIQPDVVLYTIMIKGLCDEGRVEDAFKLIKEMTDKNLVPDTQAYNTLIKGFCDKGLLEEARSLKLEISGVDEFPDSLTYTILISGLCRHGLVLDAENIFKEMEKCGCVPSVVTFNTLIDGLCKSGELQKAHLLFYKMEIGRNPSLFLRLTQSDGVFDSGSLQTLVTKMVESGRTMNAYKLLTQISNTLIVPTIVTYNILINGLCKAGFLDGARKLFNELQLKGNSPDSVTYGTLINGLQSVGREDDAFMLLEEMMKNGIKPTPSVYKTLMKWSCRRKKTFAAFNLWLRYLNTLPTRDEKVMKLVEDYLQKGEIERPVRLLLDMDIKLRDLDSGPYTIWLIGFCQGRKTNEALLLLSILKEYNINLTPPSCVMLISTLCREGKLNLALEVFLYSMQKSFVLKPRICNNLLKSLLRSQFLTRNDAFDLIEKMESCGYDLEGYLDNDTRFLLSSCYRKQEMQNLLTT